MKMSDSDRTLTDIKLYEKICDFPWDNQKGGIILVMVVGFILVMVAQPSWGRGGVPVKPV